MCFLLGEQWNQAQKQTMGLNTLPPPAPALDPSRTKRGRGIGIETGAAAATGRRAHGSGAGDAVPRNPSSMVQTKKPSHRLAGAARRPRREIRARIRALPATRQPDPREVGNKRKKHAGGSAGRWEVPGALTMVSPVGVVTSSRIKEAAVAARQPPTLGGTDGVEDGSDI